MKTLKIEIIIAVMEAIKEAIRFPVCVQWRKGAGWV